MSRASSASAILTRSTRSGLAGLTGGLRLLISRELWSATAFLVLSFPLGVFWFVTQITLISVGVATVVGLPLLALAMRLWIAGAQLERLRVAALLGGAIPSPYRPLALRRHPP